MLLATDYLALLGCILLGTGLSLGVLSKHKWLNALCYTLAAAIFFFNLNYVKMEFAWVWLLPHPSVAIVRMAAVWGPLCAIVVGLARYIPRPRDRRALYFLCVLLACYGGWVVGRQLIDPGVRPRTWWMQETMMQSTNTTCVAAATCTYLRTIGVEMSEQEAVDLGLISTYGGSEVQAWRILALELPAERYDVRIARLSHAELCASGHWYMTCVIYGPLVGHAVTIKADPGGELVTVRDPLSGEYTMAWEVFSRGWMGNVVWADKRETAGNPAGGERYAAAYK